MTAETLPRSVHSPVVPGQFVKAEQVLYDAIAAGAFPGCAFGVLADGAVVLSGAAGRFTYSADSPTVTPSTLYDVASVTKVAATTAAAMLLFQRGLLDLEMPLADLLPGFVIGRQTGSFARHVKLRHLLAHSSGLPGYVELFKGHRTPAGLLRACLELPVEAPPGTRAEYSDPGFILLGKAIEVIVDEPLPQFLRREIHQPLGMNSTGFHIRSTARAAIPPTEIDQILRHRVIQGEVQDENAYVLNGCAGHAGLFSNVPDLLRFAQEILRAYSGTTAEQSSRLYKEATVAFFAQRQEPEGSSRALGWDTPSKNSSSGLHFSAKSVGHLGYSGCSLWIDLPAQVAIVLLTNRTWPDRKNQLIREIRPAFHDTVRDAL